MQGHELQAAPQTKAQLLSALGWPYAVAILKDTCLPIRNIADYEMCVCSCPIENWQMKLTR